MTLKSLQEPLATVWPPLTEAMYLLNDLPAAQEALWEMLVRKALQLLPLGLVDLPRIRELRRKYADRPMDLADAALVRIAEREGIRKIFTSLSTGFMVGSVPQSFLDPPLLHGPQSLANVLVLAMWLRAAVSGELIRRQWNDRSPLVFSVKKQDASYCVENRRW